MTKLLLTLTLFLSCCLTAEAQYANLALDGANEYSASSVYPAANFGPLGAFDGDRKGYGWGSGGGWNDGTRDQWPDWIQVKYPRPMSVKRFVITTLQYAFYTPEEPYVGMTYCGTHGFWSFEIQSSDDGVNWTTRLTREHDYECLKEVSLPAAVRARYWRLLVTAAGDHYSRVCELEMYAG